MLPFKALMAAIGSSESKLIFQFSTASKIQTFSIDKIISIINIKAQSPNLTLFQLGCVTLYTVAVIKVIPA